MDQKQLDILNLMARLDQETPFLDESVESLSEIQFDSMEDATAAFESTLAMRDSIKTQAVASEIPEAWIDRIQNFSDEPGFEKPPSLLSALEDWIQSIRESVFGQSQSWSSGMASVLGRTQYWGAGLVTAGVLAVIFTPFGGLVDGPGLGGGIQGPALPGGAGGTSAISASLSTEENQESDPGPRINLYSELTAEKGITGLSVQPGESDKSSEDCNTVLEVDAVEAPESKLLEHCLDERAEVAP